MGKFRVVLDGFDTKEQAQAFINWYGGSGEQDSECWLQEHSDLSCANINYLAPIKTEGNDIIAQLKIFYK